jgi:hypothetical protein
MSLIKQRESTLKTLVEWLNWEGPACLGTLTGIADYSVELYLIEDEMGLPHTSVQSLLKEKK